MLTDATEIHLYRFGTFGICVMRRRLEKCRGKGYVSVQKGESYICNGSTKDIEAQHIHENSTIIIRIIFVDLVF